MSIEQERAFVDALRADERLTDVAGQLYSEAAIGGHVTLVHALDPVLGEAITPVIVDGREPIRAGEIALGGVTMRELGVGYRRHRSRRAVVGARAHHRRGPRSSARRSSTTGSPPRQATADLSSRRGRASRQPGAFAQTFAVRMAPGTTLADLGTDYTSVSPTVPQNGLGQPATNRQPAVVAGGSGRRAGRRRDGPHCDEWDPHAAPQLATLRGLGFTRRQLRSSVRWGAISVAVCAAVLGIPLGVIAGRWGWRTLGVSVGVATEAPLPTLLGAGTASALVVLAAVSAIGPAVRAGRQDPVAILAESRRHD